jgi:Carboxypeptidase regulatory-like domain/TonB-dependent Receptor Plug Domain
LISSHQSEFAIRRYVAILFAVCTAPGTAHAQVLVGHVIEEESRAPVPRAQLSLHGPGGEIVAEALSDTTGHFRMAAPLPGTYTLDVRHVAFADFVSRTIEVVGGELVEVEVRLGRVVIPLEPLVVRARSRESGRLSEFHQRLATHNFGRFITRSDLDGRAHARVTDILRTVPGITMVPVRARGRSGPERYIVAMRGSPGLCEPAVYVDGVLVRQGAGATLDEFITPDMLEGAEIYTSTVGAPSQYQQPGACGVILFWTRQGDGGEKFSWKRLLIAAGGVAAVILLVR